MQWNQLIKHPYITSDNLAASEEEQMHLSYSHATGYYAREDMKDAMEESSVMMKIDPYNYLNEKNAILLNVKNPAQFNDVYEKTIEQHFKK